MNRQHILPVRGAALITLCLASLLGCNRNKPTERDLAMERLLEATSPKEVVVPNGQAAILRLGDGFAAILPNYIQHNEIKYRIFISSNGVFEANGKPAQEGVVTTTTPIDVAGVQVFVGYGGENRTSVMLESGPSTAIALFPTNSLQMLEVSRIEFRQSKPPNPQDLKKAIGYK